MGRDDVHRPHIQHRQSQARDCGRTALNLQTFLRPLPVVAAVIALIGPASPRSGAFAIGVLRRDGLLIPFAAFDGKRWSKHWPAPSSSGLEVPVNVSSVPKGWWGPTGALVEWEAWTGGEPRIVRVQQPDWAPVHCLRQVVLRTDYRSVETAPPPTEQPYPKDGLAISPPQPLERIEIVPRAAVEVTELQGALRDSFNRAEREMAGGRFRHPIRENVREKIEPEIEAIYAFGTVPRTYYIESVRGYRPGRLGEGDCAVAFGTGWFLRDGANVVRRLDMAVDLLDCDRYGATYMLPMGVMRIGDRTFWIAQFSGWAHERFVIVEIKKATVEAAVNVFGGAC